MLLTFTVFLLGVGLFLCCLLPNACFCLCRSHAWTCASEYIWFSFSEVLNRFKLHSLQSVRQMHGPKDYQRLAGCYNYRVCLGSLSSFQNTNWDGLSSRDNPFCGYSSGSLKMRISNFLFYFTILFLLLTRYRYIHLLYFPIVYHAFVLLH